MTRSSRGFALIGMLATAVLLATGCASTVGGTPAAAPVPSEGPGSDPVAWADRVCEAVLSFAVPATSAPDFTATSNLPAVQQTVSAYLGAVVTGAQQGREQLAEVGRAPESAGDDAVGRAQSAMEALARGLRRDQGLGRRRERERPRRLRGHPGSGRVEAVGGRPAQPARRPRGGAAPAAGGRARGAVSAVDRAGGERAAVSRSARPIPLIERVFYSARRVAAVAVLRGGAAAAGRPIWRGCSAGRARSSGSGPGTRPGCRSSCPTRPGPPRSPPRARRPASRSTTVRTESGATALRTAFRCDLVELARRGRGVR